MAETRIITIENVVGGFAPSNTDTPLRPVDGLEDQYSMADVIDVFQANKLGDLAPGNVFDIVDVGSTSFIDLPMNAITDSLNKAWLVGSNSNLYKLDLSAETNDDRFTTGTDVVGGTDFVDLLTFRDQNGTEWIAWTYDAANANQADIARIQNNGLLSTRNTSFGSGLTGSGKLTKGIPHRMWNGPDGLIYCTNGRYIFQHDPITTTGNHQALDLGADWVSQAGVSYGNFSAIIGYKATTVSGANLARSQCRLWLWDGFSPDPNFIYPINDNYVSAIINKDEVLYIFSEGLENKTRVWIFNGSQLKEVASAYDSAIDSGPKQGSVEIFRGFPHWLQNPGDGNVSAVFPVGNGRYGIHELMHAYSDATSMSATGFLKNLRSNSLVLHGGVNLNGVNSLVKQNTTKYHTSSTFTTRLISLPYRSTIKRINIYFSQFGTGASLQVAMFEDYDAVSLGGAADILKNAASDIKTLTNTALGSVRQHSIHTYLNDINSFYLHFAWNHAAVTNTAAIIRKIEILYEPTTVSNI